MSQSSISKLEAEEFIVAEAELLDDWQLEEWTGLYSNDALYEVSSPASRTPRSDSPASTLFLIADRIDRIKGRASRLLKSTAHAEFPRSKTRHLITNFRVRPGEGDETNLRANFAVYRTKEDTTTVYMGEYHYRLRREDGQIRILQKRCILDINSLYDQGRLTIIL